MKNHKLDRLLFWDAMRRNVVPTLALIALLGAISIYYLNTAGTSTFETGTVIRSMNEPGKYLATDTILFVALRDGRVVNIHLAPNTMPPASGTTIKVRRVKRIWFGEYFMIAK
jgi:hypothetical protein